jgi:pSer/pThr/pTyr-binding forkhead associated (FHA) protein
MDLTVNHPSISGHHATLQLFRSGNVFVVDERSTNGTFVDGHRLSPGERVPVKPGQVLRLGAHVELKLEQPSLQATAEPAVAPLLAAPPAPAAPPPAAPAEPSRSKLKTLYAPARGDDE